MCHLNSKLTFTFLVLDCCLILRDTISAVLQDEGFKLPSPQAKLPYMCAEKLQIWISDSTNYSKASSFDKKLVHHIQGCLDESCHTRRGRERMWEMYYKLRSSSEFREMWTEFLRDSIDVDASPIFYQFVADNILEGFINLTLAVPSTVTNTVSPIDYLEANAIRYVAGYVVRAVKKKCIKSAHPLKEEIILCLSDMEQDIGKVILGLGVILLLDV